MAFDLSSGRGKARVTPSMNVTPLVDVVLVLLIIFMVVTPLLSKKFSLQIPKQDAPTDAPPDPTQLVIRLGADGRVSFNGAVVTQEELAVRLPRAVAANRDRTVFVDADDNAPFGPTVALMDLARGAGARTVAILTEPLAP